MMNHQYILKVLNFRTDMIFKITFYILFLKINENEKTFHFSLLFVSLISFNFKDFDNL
jgi:hypothetical protein